ncbi:sialate O-acetylesterase [Candidatus Poribacteria bacterium]|nr:sialate O-acetylesterase [Candidatus Poribacteria bacterium]
MRKMIVLTWCILSFGGFWTVCAEVKPAGIFTDNLVLQQGIEVPIWGTGEPGEKVTVALNAQTKVCTTQNDGRWMVKLDPLKAGGPFELMITGENTITLKNVLVGEVWVCAGQSNMEWPVNDSANSTEEIANANYPQIRLFTVPRRAANTPQNDVNGEWQQCSPATIGNFSAVAYFFGRELQKSINVPIGLIHTSWGGTRAELWTSRRALESEPELKGIIDGYKQKLTAYAKAMVTYQKVLEKHNRAVAKAKEKGKKPPPDPTPPKAPGKEPSTLYNGMIAPLLPYAIRGVIWYQGESNAGGASRYRSLFPAMIKNWREDWGQGAFPFLFVQLANFIDRKPEPSESLWAELREAQLMARSVPKTAMVVTIDIGDAKDIHPKNKQEVGRRLSLTAQAIAYDKKIVYSGPIYKSMQLEGSKVRLSFDHIGSGLEAKGEKLTGFAIAGKNRKFVWADARIEGNTVVVWSDQVSKPVAVRYAWADNPECNLYNKEGLPASPFRTDQ